MNKMVALFNLLENALTLVKILSSIGTQITSIYQERNAEKEKFL